MYTLIFKTTIKQLDRYISKKIKNKYVIGALGASGVCTLVYKLFFQDKIKAKSRKDAIDYEVNKKLCAKKEALKYEHELKEEERDNDLQRDIKREKAKTEEILKRKAGFKEESKSKDETFNFDEVEPAHVTTLNELDDVETTIEPLAGLLIPKNVSGVLIYGPKGSLKSYIVLHLLCQMNTGEPVKILPNFDPYFGKASENRPFCFYIDAENGLAEIKKRIRTYIPRMDSDRFNIICTKSFGANSMATALRAIEEKIDELPEGIIIPTVFDNLNSLLDNASSQTEAKTLLNGIKKIQEKAETRKSIFLPIIVHHENKEGKEYGSSILRALTPNIIHITETDKFDEKKLIYDHHRCCSMYNSNQPLLLEVHHSGPEDDEDIEITFKGLDGDDRDNDTTNHSESMDTKKRNSSKWNNEPVRDNIRNLYWERKNDRKSIASREMSEAYKKKYKDGPSHTTMSNLMKDLGLTTEDNCNANATSVALAIT